VGNRKEKWVSGVCKQVNPKPEPRPLTHFQDRFQEPTLRLLHLQQQRQR
jgi:hypothetical protein